MKSIERVDRQLEQILAVATDHRCPEQFAKALSYAVFPGGSRLRPMLCLAANRACGADEHDAAVGVAAAVELMHCASLVHDDLPCFDDAETRRGKLSVHRAYCESTAVLVGDTLIVLAFDTVAAALAGRSNGQLVSGINILARASSVPDGIAAGQAWELEPNAELQTYHDAKTGALFAAATGLGAVAAGHEADGWLTFGRRIGCAYQAIDDIRDSGVEDAELGKPAGQDERLGRPNVACQMGMDEAHQYAADLIDQALDSIPDCPGQAVLRQEIAEQFGRFCKIVGLDVDWERAGLVAAQ